MASIKSIRDGLKDRLAAVAGTGPVILLLEDGDILLAEDGDNLTAEQVVAIPGELYTHDTIPDDIYPPAAIVGMPTRVAYDFSFRSAVTRFTFPVRVICGRTTERESQDKLDDFASADGPSSLRATIDADPTLGGVANTTRVVEARDFGVYEVAGVGYIGMELEVEVIA